jgi:hypothetical protein
VVSLTSSPGGYINGRHSANLELLIDKTSSIYLYVKELHHDGTNCVPLLADLFLCSYESEFLQKLVTDNTIHEARAFNFTYRYIDDVLSINNSRFAECLPGNQNNCYWPLHKESIARCKHHMQEKLVYCCTHLENL